jgi:hypothetical protein
MRLGRTRQIYREQCQLRLDFGPFYAVEGDEWLNFEDRVPGSNLRPLLHHMRQSSLVLLYAGVVDHSEGPDATNMSRAITNLLSLSQVARAAPDAPLPYAVIPSHYRSFDVTQAAEDLGYEGYQVDAHELGHLLLGSGHLREDNNLMSENAPSDRLSPAQCQAIRQNRNLVRRWVSGRTLEDDTLETRFERHLVLQPGFQSSPGPTD